MSANRVSRDSYIESDVADHRLVVGQTDVPGVVLGTVFSWSLCIRVALVDYEGALDVDLDRPGREDGIVEDGDATVSLGRSCFRLRAGWHCCCWPWAAGCDPN